MLVLSRGFFYRDRIGRLGILSRLQTLFHGFYKNREKVMDDDLYYFLKRIDKLHSLLEDKDTPEVDKIGIVNEIFLLETWKDCRMTR